MLLGGGGGGLTHDGRRPFLVGCGNGSRACLQNALRVSCHAFWFLSLLSCPSMRCASPRVTAHFAPDRVAASTNLRSPSLGSLLVCVTLLNARLFELGILPKSTMLPRTALTPVLLSCIDLTSKALGFLLVVQLHAFQFWRRFPNDLGPLVVCCPRLSFTRPNKPWFENKLRMPQYFLQLVPTVYRLSSGVTVHSNQYSATEHLKHVHTGGSALFSSGLASTSRMVHVYG